MAVQTVAMGILGYSILHMGIWLQFHHMIPASANISLACLECLRMYVNIYIYIYIWTCCEYLAPLLIPALWISVNMLSSLAVSLCSSLAVCLTTIMITGGLYLGVHTISYDDCPCILFNMFQTHISFDTGVCGANTIKSMKQPSERSSACWHTMWYLCLPPIFKLRISKFGVWVKRFLTWRRWAFLAHRLIS